MGAYGDPWYCQLYQYLWCKYGELPIGFVHKFPLICIFLRGQLIIWPNSSRRACRIILATYHTWQAMEHIFLLKKWKIVKPCVQNQWRVLHAYITEIGGVANIKDPHRRPLSGFSTTLNIHNSWTDYLILLKLSQFSCSYFSAFVECTYMSRFRSPLI